MFRARAVIVIVLPVIVFLLFRVCSIYFKNPCSFKKQTEGSFYPVFVEVDFINNRTSRLLYVFDITNLRISQVLKAVNKELPLSDACPGIDSFKLAGGMAVIINEREGKTEIYVGRMNPAFRLILGFPIDINSAPREVIANLPYLNSRIADEIIAQRSRRLFRNVNELLNIKGVGGVTLFRIKDYVECLPTPVHPTLVCSISRYESF